MFAKHLLSVLGKRLFGSELGAEKLKPVKTEPTGNGVVMSLYRRQ